MAFSPLFTKGDNEPSVLVLTERMDRASIWLKVPDHSAKVVDISMKSLLTEFGDKYREVFNTITADNGLEFAGLSELKKIGIGV